MKDLQEKIAKLLETLQSGQLKVEVDTSSWTAYINGIELTITEQLQLMREYGDIPTLEALFKELNNSLLAKNTYEEDMFKVVMNKMKDVFKTDLSDNGISHESDTIFPTDRPNVNVTFPYPYSGISMNDLVAQKANKVNEETKKANDVNKDARIAELEQKLAQAEKKIAELGKQLQPTEQEKLSEKDLKFPQHFKKIDKNTSKVVTIGDVQKIVDELKELEVPYGSFVLTRVGNVAVLKIHDDQGIGYLVTTDFYQAYLD